MKQATVQIKWTNQESKHLTAPQNYVIGTEWSNGFCAPVDYSTKTRKNTVF